MVMRRRWLRVRMLIGLMVCCAVYLAIVVPRLSQVQSDSGNLVAYFAKTDETCVADRCSVSLILLDPDTGAYTTQSYTPDTVVNPESVHWSPDRRFILFYSAEGLVIYSLANDTFQAHALNDERWYVDWLFQGIFSLDVDNMTGYPSIIPLGMDNTLNAHLEYELAHIPTRSRPVFTQDHQRMAIVKWTEEDPFKEIFVVDMGTGERQSIVHSPDPIYGLLWSPGGRSLIFLVNGETQMIVYRYDRETKITEQVTAFAAPISYMTDWLDGDRILFYDYLEDQPEARFHIFNIETKQDIGISSISYGFDPSPDKRKIIFARHEEAGLLACLLEIASQQRTCFSTAPRPIDNTVMAWSTH